MGDIALHCGDAAEVMRAEIPDGSIDLILTSPPYDNLRKYANGHTFDFPAVAAECKRCLKPGGVLVWVVGDETKDGSESGTSFRQALHFKEIGLRLRDTMIWRKETPFPGGDQATYYRPAFEFMFVLTRGRPNTINLLRTPCKGAVRERSIHINQHGLPNKRSGTVKILTKPDKVRQNVWDYPTLTESTGRSAQPLFA